MLLIVWAGPMCLLGIPKTSRASPTLNVQFLSRGESPNLDQSQSERQLRGNANTPQIAASGLFGGCLILFFGFR